MSDLFPEVIYIVLAIVVIWVIWTTRDQTKGRKKINHAVVTDFLGGDLYRISLNQLRRYMDLFRHNPTPELEEKMASFLGLTLSSQMASKLTEEDLDLLELSGKLFSVDDVNSKVDIKPLLPEFKKFILEGVHPQYLDINPTITIGLSVFYVDKEVQNLCLILSK